MMPPFKIIMALASGMCLFSVVAKAEGGSLLPADMSSIEVPQPHSDVVGGGSPNSTTDGDPAQFNVPAQAAYRSYPNYITMGIIHSPKDIDWKNAGTMMKSYVANSIAVDMGDAHSIGHVAFEVSCTMPSGRQTVVTGQTDYGGMDEYYKMLWRDHSYGAFFDYVTGALQDETSIAKDFGKLSQRDGKMAFVTILLSPQSCAEALKYMAAYQSEGVYKRYGLGIRPIYKEGGGCANYAASVLQVAGPSDFAAFNKNWSRTFYIPLRLIHIGERAERSVFDQLSIYDWSVVPSEPYRVLHFFDPDLMHAWVMSNKDSSAVQGHNVVKQYKINAASGFVLDYSSDTAPTAWWLQD